jgi:hypothetical protein
MSFVINLIAIFKAFFELLALVKQAREEGWLQEGRELAKGIKDAKTDEERRKLVRRLANHTSSAP